MSRVYDTPRYEDQTLNKVLLHLDISARQFPLAATVPRTRFGCVRAGGKVLQDMIYEMECYEILELDETKCRNAYEVDEVDFYVQYALADACARPGSENYIRTASVGRILGNMINAHKALPIWCDYDAASRLICGYLDGRYTANMHARDMHILSLSENIARDIVTLSLAACRMGCEVTSRVKSGIRGRSVADGRWRDMVSLSAALELVRMKSMTPGVREEHDTLRAGGHSYDHSGFSVASTKAARALGCDECYRIVGLYVIVMKDAIYVLDYSSLDQLHQCAKMWEGFFTYAANHRVCGDQSMKLTTKHLDKCAVWVCDAMVGSDYSDALGRSMKQSLALLQNEMHSDQEKLNVNWQSKSAALRIAIRDILPMQVYWHDFIGKLDVPYRTKLDVAHVFYALPAPDCNLACLFEKASITMQHPNVADAMFFHGFMCYCFALDFCKAVVSFKKEVTYKTQEGYDPTTKEWYKRCMRGTLTLPPDNEMGMVWIEGFFPYNDTVQSWYWEAADVTHVDANDHYYESLHTFREIPREHHNELLYALTHAPMLSGNRHPFDVVTNLGTGKDTWHRQAVMAAKCENTKPGKKVRETFSADDITRELTSALDRAGIPLATLYAGVTARKSDASVRAIFDRIANLTRPSNPGRVIVISNDVSGWSPSADRAAWQIHHDYVVRTTKAPANLTVANIWKGINARVVKRGFIASTPLTKGMFQGWTGTLDSLMNVRISLYCVRQGKRQGTIREDEAATTAGLIDDAVQAVELSKDSTIEAHQVAADRHFDTTVKTWRSLAAEIDPVKTIYSTIKCIYLNTFICEGSEVMVPMKVFARADKEFNRRFASVHSQFDTVLGSFRSAMGKGACPLASYYFGVQRCVQLAIYTNKVLIKAPILKAVNAAFAPRSLGGWGIPHFTSWVTQEGKDELTRYTGVMTSAIDSIADPGIKQQLSDLIEATLNQPLASVSALQALGAPRNVVAKHAPNPTGDIVRTLKKGMISKCKSVVFKAALQAGESDGALAALRTLLESCTWDAVILELLGQCLPSSCSAALVDRAHKNELVTQLFPFRVRANMSRRVRKGGAAAVEFLCAMQVDGGAPIYSRSDAYDLAFQTRERFYRQNNLCIVNHTTPDYGTALARQPAGTNVGIEIKCLQPRSSCAEQPVLYANMYDGIPPGERSRMHRSASAYTFTGGRFRHMTPIQLCVSKAAIVSAYITSEGGHGKLFWDTVMAVWGSPYEVTPPVVVTAVKPHTSTKRLDPSRAHLTHPIAMFRNTQECVRADATPLGRYLSHASVHVDYMSFVTAAKVTALLCMSCADGMQIPEDLQYAFLEGTLPITVPTHLTADDTDSVTTALRLLVETSDKSLFPQVMDSMKDVNFTGAEDEEYIAIGFNADHLGAVRAGNEVSIAAGYLSNIIDCGVVAPTSVRKGTLKARIAGDEVIPTTRRRAENKLRHLSNVVPRPQALLCVMMDIVRDLCKGDICMRIAQSPWGSVPDEFTAQFPKWAEMWSNVRQFAVRYSSTIPEPVARALLGHVPNHVVMHLVHLDENATDSAALCLAYLYLASYGRLRTAESYTLTSALGPEGAARVWMLAHRIRSAPVRDRAARVGNPRERAAMASVYYSMGMAARAFHSKAKRSRCLGASSSLYLSHHRHQRHIWTFHSCSDSTWGTIPWTTCQVYRGTRQYTRLGDPDEADVDEFRTVLDAIGGEDGGAQRGDEVEG